MKLQELVVLLPCHSLEDFPTHHEGDEAQGLLANWSALWHPALLASAESMPTWYRADCPPEDVTNRLIVVPGVSESELPTGFPQRAETDACLIRNKIDRDKITETALAALDETPTGIDADLVADFLALGYCYLQVELLTRQMRYSSNLDEIHFQNQLIEAATAAVQGDHELAHDRLSACFDILAEERDHYYPVDAFILDMTLVAPTTIGRSLRDQLAAPIASNLLLSAELLTLMAESEPESLASLRQAVENGSAGIIGGEDLARRLPMVSCETILDQLRRGLAQYDALLGRRPIVFGRQRFGLTPVLPQILLKLGFEAALHATLEEGVFPEGSQVKIRWEGCDGTTLDAIGRPPADATKAGAYLNYAVKLGESMDMDHVATICFAHWPGQTSPWYEDLRRIARYCSALGKFVTVDEYFHETDIPVHQDRFRADQYRSPYLRQAVVREQPNPISSSVRYWRRRAIAEAAQSLDTLAVLVTGTDAAGPATSDASSAATPVDLLSDIDLHADERDVTDDQSIDEQLDSVLDNRVQRFADGLPRSDDDAQSGYLVTNPLSFVRRVGVWTPELESLPTVERPIYAAAESAGSKHVVVDVPAMGFAWIAPGGRRSRSKKSEQPMAEECILRNEFFEALIDPATGGLRAIRAYQSRGNRISQQLALRLGSPKRRRGGAEGEDPGNSSAYSVMAADSVKTTIATPALGEIVARGHLLDRRGKELAGYQQTYRLWRGSRVLSLEIELEPKVECKSNPWESYFGARFAWTSEAADLYRSVNQTRQSTKAKRFEAPHYIEIDEGTDRTTILTGGLPFHRRQGLRMLDSLLVVRGEQCRKFQLGIGIDLKHPMQEALSLLTPTTMARQTAAPPTPGGSSWLFHIDSRNVTATYWEPIVEEGRATGFRVRLLETGGRTAKAKLSAFRPIASARQLNLNGESSGDCQLDDGQIQLQLISHEWVQLEARW